MMNPFVETLKSKEELILDFAEFVKRRDELGQNAMFAHYGFCHGEAIRKFFGNRGDLNALLKRFEIPVSNVAYFQAGVNAWVNLYEGKTKLPEINPNY